ncbi:MAG TPA: adenylate/guanylate cyclase domain-containing protein, partial [Mycobacterium sp.]|nr:adenylate/guanylate cyclase domain-containing protein [Mycobacterium sp.]
MAPEQTSCATCGTEPRPGARFCDACGAPISRLTAPTEHKQVTVLFADVVRSMELAATLDAEALRDVMSELFSHCGAVVERLGGTVDKFTGDGIMALFGAPIAMEDHAVRACLAALEVQREARRLSEGVLRRYGVGYDVRVGLNSGDVITGQIGSSPTSYTAVGVHVGMAQRMESAAQPGAVMISESTARLVESIADLGEPELVTIKGRQEPVLARRLLAVGVRHEPSDRRPSTLIGRQREADALETL